MSEQRKRGFAALTPEERSDRASKAGRAAQAKGTAHRWTREEAQAAGRKGGQARAAQRTVEEMEALSARGHEARRERKKR